MTALPAIVANALLRRRSGEQVVLTRVMFSHILHALIDLAPQDPRREEIQDLLDMPPAPDWVGKDLQDFIDSYAWHILFAQAPKALDWMSYTIHTHSIPPYWEASVRALCPEDMTWVWQWAKKANAKALMGALLETHLGCPEWTEIWERWIDAPGRCEWFIHPNLVARLESLDDMDGALDILRRIAPDANSNIDALAHAPGALDSHVLMVLLGARLTQERALSYRQGAPLPISENTHLRLLEDAHSKEGQASLLAAFPHARDFCAKGRDAREAYHRTRMDQAMAPVMKKVRVPVRGSDVKNLIENGWVYCESLHNIDAYDQRCRDALASGMLSLSDSQKIHKSLADLHRATQTASLRIGSHTQRDIDKGYGIPRTTSQAIEQASTRLGAKGYGALATAGIELCKKHSSPYGGIGSFPYDGAAEVFLANPSDEGLDWLAGTPSNDHQILTLLSAPHLPRSWASKIIKAYTSVPDRWQGSIPHQTFSSGLLITGSIWDIPNPELRLEWFDAETAKPVQAWDLSAQDLDNTRNLTMRYGPQMKPLTALIGVVRFALAAKMGDMSWITAFSNLASRTKAEHVPTSLLNRWKMASGHKRLHAIEVLSDPPALIAMERKDVEARLAEIFD